MATPERIAVRADRCISSGMCVGERPDIFRFNEEGISEVYRNPDGRTDDLSEVAALCPVSAIIMSEDDGPMKA